MPLNKNVIQTYSLGDYEEYDIKAATNIYEGAAVGVEAATGLARGLVAGDYFKGFSKYQANNSAGANGALRVQVQVRGVIKLPIAGLVAADVGKKVYASADDTFTLTSAGNSEVGRVQRLEASGVALVAFDATRLGP